jgi:hypothetical protein
LRLQQWQQPCHHQLLQVLPQLRHPAARTQAQLVQQLEQGLHCTQQQLELQVQPLALHTPLVKR